MYVFITKRSRYIQNKSENIKKNKFDTQKL